MVNELGNLVLSRGEGERVLIGDNIEIEVVKIEASRVRLAIRAPKDVAIKRPGVEKKL